MRRVVGWILVLLAAGVLVVVLRPAWTPGIRGSNAVASLETLGLGGVEQAVLIRGRDRNRPILLFLHGGPGMPVMYLAHRFSRSLEEDFLVVHWDQRGAGKSYRKDLPAESMSVRRILADAEELVGKLQARFGERRLLLAGHSWGSYLGMLLAGRDPDWLCGYVGVGQVAHEARARQLADEFIRRRAREAGRPEVIEEMDRSGGGAREKWLFRFGAELHEGRSFLPLLAPGLLAPEYSFRDALKVAPGSSFSSRRMKYDAIAGELMDEVREVGVPVYFLQGRHDWVSPGELVEEYLRGLVAPAKELVWFEDSAHFPFFEESERFTLELRRVLERTPACGR